MLPHAKQAVVGAFPRPALPGRWPSLNPPKAAKPDTKGDEEKAAASQQLPTPDIFIQIYPDATYAGQSVPQIDIVAIHSVGEDSTTAWRSLAPNSAPLRVSRSRATQSWLLKMPSFDEMEPPDAAPRKPEPTGSRNVTQNSNLPTPEDSHAKESKGSLVSLAAASFQDSTMRNPGPSDIPTIVETPVGEAGNSAMEGINNTVDNTMLNPKFSPTSHATSNTAPKPARGSETANVDMFHEGLSSQPVGVDWLKDPNMLPAVFPDARIMRLQGEITALDLSSQDFLQSLANKLINSLTTHRLDHSRPIIFICYGIGGIILQQMVISLGQDPNDEILPNVAGIMFLATPFRDAIGVLNGAIYGASGTEKDKIKTSKDLRETFGKGTLSKLLDNFIQAAKRYQFEMSCFYQRDKIHHHNDDPHIVYVNRENGSLEAYPANASPADFRFMSKYTGPNDPTYKAVLEELASFRMHSAAASNKTELVESLVIAGASVNCQNRLKQTPLLLAALHGSLQTVTWLLEHGADIAHKDVDGKMTIHYAVLCSNKDLVKMLLKKGAVVDAKDSYGESAWDIARRRGTADIKRLLRNRPLIRGPRLNPYTESSTQPTHSPHSEAAKESCLMTEATIIDFFNVDEQELYFEIHPPLYNVIYGEGPKKILMQYRDRKHKELNPKFSWYHLPSNNPAWVEALFAKLGFPPSMAMMNPQLHRGSTPHSKFLKPIAREKDGITAVFMPYFDFELHSKRSKMTQMINIADSNTLSPVEYLNYSEDGFGLKCTEDGQSSSEGILGVIAEQGIGPAESTTRDVSSLPSDGAKSRMSASRFGPSESKEATERDYGDFVARDIRLMHAYLRYEPSLHVRRTLDQFYYFMLDNTAERDTGQVVYRWAKNQGDEDPMIIMVNQMWLWILPGGTVISSFPERWDRQDNYPDVLTGILEFLRSENRAVLARPCDLAALIMRYCLTVFERVRFKEGFKKLQFMDMFESDIGFVADKEPECFQRFKKYSTALSNLETTMKLEPWNSLTVDNLKSVLQEAEREQSRYSKDIKDEVEERMNQLKLHINMREVLEGCRKPKNYHEAEAFILDKLINIDKETELLTEIKDVKDELNIMATLLEEQKEVLKSQDFAKQLTGRTWARLNRILEAKQDEINKLTNHADKVYAALTSLLDLRQRQTHVSEARSARKQAELSGRQQDTLMIFTIVTIIFLPLSFMASFFALNITVFPQSPQGSNSFTLDYVAKYIFGISAALIVPLVIIAFNVDTMTSAVQESWVVRKMGDFVAYAGLIIRRCYLRIKIWLREAIRELGLQLGRSRLRWRDRIRYFIHCCCKRKKRPRLPQHNQDFEAEETEDTKAYLQAEKALASRREKFVQEVRLKVVKDAIL